MKIFKYIVVLLCLSIGMVLNAQTKQDSVNVVKGSEVPDVDIEGTEVINVLNGLPGERLWGKLTTSELKNYIRPCADTLWKSNDTLYMSNIDCETFFIVGAGNIESWASFPALAAIFMNSQRIEGLESPNSGDDAVRWDEVRNFIELYENGDSLCPVISVAGVLDTLPCLGVSSTGGNSQGTFGENTIANAINRWLGNTSQIFINNEDSGQVRTYLNNTGSLLDIQTNSAWTIDGDANYNLGANEAVSLVSTGSEWVVYATKRLMVANNVAFNPVGNLAATNIQAMAIELDSEKLENPTIAGIEKYEVQFDDLGRAVKQEKQRFEVPDISYLDSTNFFNISNGIEVYVVDRRATFIKQAGTVAGYNGGLADTIAVIDVRSGYFVIQDVAGFWDVENFGAKPYTIQSQQVYFQAAANMAAATKRFSVLIPAHDYYLGGQIICTDQVCWLGMGGRTKRSHLWIDGIPVNQGAFKYVNHEDGVVIEEIAFDFGYRAAEDPFSDGNFGGQQVAAWFIDFTEGAKRAIIEANYFRGDDVVVTNGIRFASPNQGSYSNTVERNNFHSRVDSAVVIYATGAIQSNANTFYDNKFWGTKIPLIVNGQGDYIVKNTFESLNYPGVHALGEWAIVFGVDAKQNYVAANYFNSSSTNVVRMDGDSSANYVGSFIMNVNLNGQNIDRPNNAQFEILNGDKTSSFPESLLHSLGLNTYDALEILHVNGDSYFEGNNRRISFDEATDLKFGTYNSGRNIFTDMLNISAANSQIESLVDLATANLLIGATHTAIYPMQIVTNTALFGNQAVFQNRNNSNGAYVGIGFNHNTTPQTLTGTKAGVGFIKNASFSRGELVFSVSNTADLDSYTESDIKMRLSRLGYLLLDDYTSATAQTGTTDHFVTQDAAGKLLTTDADGFKADLLITGEDVALIQNSGLSGDSQLEHERADSRLDVLESIGTSGTTVSNDTVVVDVSKYLRHGNFWNDPENDSFGFGADGAQFMGWSKAANGFYEDFQMNIFGTPFMNFRLSNLDSGMVVLKPTFLPESGTPRGAIAMSKDSTLNYFNGDEWIDISTRIDFQASFTGNTDDIILTTTNEWYGVEINVTAVEDLQSDRLEIVTSPEYGFEYNGRDIIAKVECDATVSSNVNQTVLEMAFSKSGTSVNLRSSQGETTGNANTTSNISFGFPYNLSDLDLVTPMIRRASTTAANVIVHKMQCRIKK